jgi:hypothetical protein
MPYCAMLCPAVVLVSTQLYHAWNQLRTLGMPVRCWPGIIAAVVAELLADNPIRGRLMLGAALWAMQVCVLICLCARVGVRGTSQLQQHLQLVEARNC